MRKIAIALAALIAFAMPLRAQAASDPRIEAVIMQQLDAFKSNDGIGAFKHASPMIQGMFGDPVTFLGMVQSGYPQISRSRSAKFLNFANVEGKLIQTVLIEGADGTFVTAAYEMIEIDGVWRINGVTLIKGEAA